MMKILYVNEYYPPYVLGGAEISMFAAARELAKRHEVHVLTPNYGTYKSTVSREHGCIVHRFASRRHFAFKKRKISGMLYRTAKNLFNLFLGIYAKYSSLELKKKIEELHAAEKFDVIHAHNHESVLALSAAKIDAKKIAHLRDFRLVKSAKTCTQIDHFIAISRFVKAVYAGAGIKARKISVIYNPLIEENISKLSRKSARLKLGVSGEKIILFVGSLTKDKGIDLLPEIARLLPEYDFLIAGEGHDKDFLLKIPGNVHVVGYVPYKNLKDYYKASDILIVPSRWPEPFGRVVIEGQANGCVVIADKAGALPELIRNNVTGILTDGDFAGAVKRLSERSAAVIRKNCRKIKHLYNAKTAAQRMECIYKSVLDSGK